MGATACRYRASTTQMWTTLPVPVTCTVRTRARGRLRAGKGSLSCRPGCCFTCTVQHYDTCILLYKIQPQVFIHFAHLTVIDRSRAGRNSYTTVNLNKVGLRSTVKWCTRSAIGYDTTACDALALKAAASRHTFTDRSCVGQAGIQCNLHNCCCAAWLLLR